MRKLKLLLLALCCGLAWNNEKLFAQMGDIIWQEEFNSINPDVWQFDIGNGNWGWGNGELEYYKKENASIQEVPGEAGNKALVITAKRETVGAQQFTSAKLKSQNKLAVKYGMVETRIMVPNLEGGFWPAFWMLGAGPGGWPRIGEIDIMEMGHNEAQRKKHLFTETAPAVNNYVAANFLWYEPLSCSNDNQSCAANATWEPGSAKPYVSETPMHNRWITYRMYWSSSAIRITAVDNGTEYDLFHAPFGIAADKSTACYQKPFYFLINLAIGGHFPNIMDPAGITANFPSEMWVDYIKVTQWNGEGEIITGPVSEKKTGVLGILTDGPTDSNIQPGIESDVYVWENTMTAGTTSPYLGENGIAWKTDHTKGWFGAGITSRSYLNLSDYNTGSIRFWVKMPANVGFKIGVEAGGVQKWVDFEANTTKYSIQRTGDWEQAIVPMSAFAGLDLQQVTIPFMVLSGVGGQANDMEMAFDEIIWDPAPYPSIAPVVSIEAPVGGTETDAPATITITANATDPDGTIQRVAFYSGTELIGIDQTAPYAIEWKNIPAGKYALSAKAIDNTNIEVSSGTVTIHVKGSGIGDLIWKEDFNTLNTNIWKFDIGNGNWGWGNGELEYYRQENASIQDVPGETGNKALVIEAKRENFGGKEFTSARLKSVDGVAVKYGVVEMRLRMPDVAGGLWPAAWMLGTGAGEWPKIGEIDLMEMGQNAGEKARQGYPEANVNHYSASNLIWYSDKAKSQQNPTGAASAAWDVNYANPYIAENSLANRFVTYRMYWSPTSVDISVIDNGTEHFMFSSTYYISEESKVFQKPFYFLLNLAVGGQFPDIMNASGITAALPAKMYVDYISVSKWNGHGEVILGKASQTAPAGKFGVFTDNTVVSSKITPGTDADIFTWNNLIAANETAAEGQNVISWNNASATQWWGAGIHTRDFWNLSAYQGGSIRFKIKMASQAGFKVGFGTQTSEAWVNFPANQSNYGFTRSGNWEEVTIPLSAFAGVTDLSKVKMPFAIASLDPLAANTYAIALDDIVWLSPGDPSIVHLQTSAPANGIAFVEGENISLSANIYSGNKTVTAVEYYQGSTLIATSNTSPYAVSWNEVQQGSYTLKAIASINSERVASADVILKVIANGKNTVVPNIAPVALTTDTITLSSETSSATLAGLNSYDPDNGPMLLTYTWKQLSGAAVTISDATAAQPVLSGLKSGQSYTFGLVVFDGTDSSQMATSTIVVDPLVIPCMHFEAENWLAMQGVQTENTTDDGGGKNVGWIDTGDWLEYQVNVPVNGNYDITIRVASIAASGAVQIQTNGMLLATLAVPNSGGWQNWTSIRTNTKLMAGTQTIRLYASGSPFNMNWFEICFTDNNMSNSAPLANAGNNQNLSAGTTSVSLNGSASYDPDNGPSALTYQWTQTAGNNVTIQSPNSASPLVTGLQNGQSYTFQLVVNDGSASSTADEVIVAVAAGTSDGCSFVAANNEWSATISNTANPVITFVPGANLTGTTWVNVAGFVNGQIIGAWSMKYEGGVFTKQINVSAGTNFSWFFTYGLPTGGQRDNSAKPCQVVVGSCGNVETPVLTSIEITATSFTLSAGQSMQFNATGKDQFGNPIACVPNWEIAGPGAIDAAGLYTAPVTIDIISSVDITAWSGTVEASISVEIMPQMAGCSFTASNGDFTSSITNEANPTITFVPLAPIAGCSWVILTAFKNGAIVGAWYMEKSGNNFVKTINATAGTNLQWYFTYQIPGGGQRDSNGERNQTVVGECTAQAKAAIVAEANVYPNPSNGNFTIDITGLGNRQIVSVRITNLTGNLIYNNQLITDDNGRANLTLSLHVTPGMYTLSIIGNNSVISNTLVIQ